MKKVLIVSYYYPPVGEVGVFRTLKFTKYLPEFGFMPIVLTVRNRSIGAPDMTLLEEVPREVKVIATFSAEHRIMRAPNLLGVNLKWLFVPDLHIGWLPFAVRSGEAAVRKEGVDIIFATAPVVTSLLAGYVLKQRTGKPLVLDFRDPWTQNVFTTYPTQLHRKIEERIEKLVLRCSDYVITTTDEMRRGLEEKYPFLRGRCETIPNGFDSSDFRGLSRTVTPDRFTLAFAGRLYGPRTAKHFLAALRNVLDAKPGLRGKIRVVFAGPKDGRTRGLVRTMRLGDVVEMVGFLAYRQSLQLMVNADVLLLVMGLGEITGNGAGAMMIPGKTFEYLAARRPILALVPPGAVADMITRTGSGVVVPPEQVHAIEAAILDLYGRWEAGTLAVASHDISMFERRNLAARLAAVFDSFCSDGGDT